MVPLALAVVVLCIAGTLAAFALGFLADDRETYPVYSVEGVRDGSTVSGEAHCEDIGESSREAVLRFTYSLECDGEAISMESYLFMDGNRPVDSLYSESGTMEVCGIPTVVWVPVDGSGFCYCISSDGEVLGISIEKDGISAFAQAVP